MRVIPVEIDLSERTAVVTGAGRGIGAVIAKRFAQAGANVVAAARTEAELEETVDCVEAHGVDGLAVPTDLRQVEAVDRLVKRSIDTFGAPEILINNAAANLPRPPLEQPLEEVDMMLETNLRGLFLLSQRYGQAVREHGVDHGRIINISSIAGQLGLPQMTLYSGTKSGVYGVTRGLAAELARDGVTVNSVTPGTIRVERIDDLIEEKGEDIYYLDRVPLGRLGEPEDVADACLFLASDLAEYVTGEDIRVDGGVGVTAGLYK